MAHYQVVMVSGVAPPDSAFVPVDHLAFRAGTFDDLRAIRANLAEAGVEGIIHLLRQCLVALLQRL